MKLNEAEQAPGRLRSEDAAGAKLLPLPERLRTAPKRHRETTARGAGRLMAFVQEGGYIIASIMPFTVGWLRGHSDDLSKACFMIAVGIGLLIGFAMRFSPEGRID
ncbi:hypothetical protein [Agrobacterium pusense]|uniref:hypothetical protein n=1 Tax=Agrobacterium pusense TaxID=648995 RepID=UPI00156B5E85|nr:hypothetical protein [Agrobacterium pusense]QKJ94538.1 hypothetical protein HQN82_24375 [Agrobacterium pusense]